MKQQVLDCFAKLFGGEGDIRTYFDKQYHNTLHLHCQEISGDCKRKSPPETFGFFVKPAHVSKILILGKFHSFQTFCIVFFFYFSIFLSKLLDNCEKK